MTDALYSIGNAKISGMEDDLDLSSNEYSISLVVFFIGYVVFEVPSKYVLSHRLFTVYYARYLTEEQSPAEPDPSVVVPVFHHGSLGCVDLCDGCRQEFQASRRAASYHWYVAEPSPLDMFISHD